MKTVYVCFANHFDLVWRRCWDQEYEYEGARYHSYRRIEELCIKRNIELAEKGEGAYHLEQGLSLRAYLEKHPKDLNRLQRLYGKGLFEMDGAGEAIIDTNMCGIETMCRNMASGIHYIDQCFGLRPSFAYYADGFGSSAQFPQIIRQCGMRGIHPMTYNYPTKPYWRGLDGSTVFFLENMPGRSYFHDHCYHEPCRICNNVHAETCPACKGTGLDLPQNSYFTMETVADDAFVGDRALYQVWSEEMLPPEGFSRTLRGFEKAQRDVRYRWGTPSHMAGVFQKQLALADRPPKRLISPKVENNPIHSGCLVSRIRIKQLARRCEAAFFGWETALALSLTKGAPARWERLFLMLPHFFFHDAITGTHQDNAHCELKEQMQELVEGVDRAAIEALGAKGVAGWERGRGAKLAVFNPGPQPSAVRVPLPIADRRQQKTWVAESEDGRRFPITFSWHSFGPAQPKPGGRLTNSTGPDARTRPSHGEAWIEAEGLSPLQWNNLRIKPTAAPAAMRGSCLRNSHLRIRLGDNGVENIEDTRAGECKRRASLLPGELLLEEDIGDPWATREIPSFRKPLSRFTHLLGALQFDGYQEAYYAGQYEPNLRFGREEDSKVFALSWYVTVRLLENARRVDFEYEIFWKTADRRLRVAFPTPAGSDRGFYSIPGGWLERDRYDVKETCLWSPNGDWPAIYFFGALNRSPQHGWAVVNYGTPSARIENGSLMVSLLRSPGFGHCLERYAQSYPMPTSGIRDGGWHHFTLSLVPFDGEADVPRLALEAKSLNERPPVMVGPAMPAPAGVKLVGPGVELAAVKFPFDRKDTSGRIVRLVNHNRTETRCAIVLDQAFEQTADVCTMTEDRESSLAAHDGQIELQLRPFEIKTLRLRLKAKR